MGKFIISKNKFENGQTPTLKDNHYFIRIGSGLSFNSMTTITTLHLRSLRSPEHNISFPGPNSRLEGRAGTRIPIVDTVLPLFLIKSDSVKNVIKYIKNLHRTAVL